MERVMATSDLDMWYSYIFDHAFLAVFNIEMGNKTKIRQNIKEIIEFEKALVTKMNSVENSDLLQDLEIMLKQVNNLRNYYTDAVKSNGGTMEVLVEYQPTLLTCHNLKMWVKGIYDHVGIMLLQHNNVNKMTHFVEELHQLHQSLLFKIDNVDGEDLKSDLMSLAENIQLIQQHFLMFTNIIKYSRRML